MYRPRQIGVLRRFSGLVVYREFAPCRGDLAYCFWELRTRKKLDEDFNYLVLPDGCVDLVFDVSDTPGFDGALAMTPDTRAIELNLGRFFAYIGVRLQPGAWVGPLGAVVGGSWAIENLGVLDLRRIRESLVKATDISVALNDVLARLEQAGFVSNVGLAGALLQSSSEVASYATSLGYSRRQTQRILRKMLGFAPHDFLKIIRFQQTLQHGASDSYADQSHYIREFKRITGLTPGKFRTAYMNASDLSNTAS